MMKQEYQARSIEVSPSFNCREMTLRDVFSIESFKTIYRRDANKPYEAWVCAAYEIADMMLQNKKANDGTVND